MEASRMTFLHLLAIFAGFHHIHASSLGDFKYTKIVGDANLTELVNVSSVTPVYFFHMSTVKNRAQDGGKALKDFLAQYEKAAEFLVRFGIKMAIAECDDSTLEICSDKSVQENIQMYRNGKFLVKVGVETLFDLDSIVGNVLQLNMLKDVRILQTVGEREDLLNKNKGKKHVLFSFQKAMGTYEHRIFLETAFSHKEEFTFAITTEMDGVKGLSKSDLSKQQKNAEIWFLSCRYVKEHETCPDTKYSGVMDLTNVARFITFLSNPVTFDIPGDGDTAIYETQDIHLVVFIYDQDSKEDVMKKAYDLGKDYFGTLGVITVDAALVNTADRFEHNRAANKPPTVAMKLFGKSITYMINQLTKENIAKFVQGKLMSAEKEATKARMDQQADSYIPSSTDAAGFDDEIQTPDDEVAEVVRQFQKKSKLDLTSVTALTDETFPETVMNHKVTMVLFYVAFDPVGVVFLHSLTTAIKASLDDSANALVRRVECFDWTDVCKHQNITTYPSVYIYRKGGDRIKYHGLLDGQTALNYLKMHMLDNPIKLGSKDIALGFIAGTNPTGAKDYIDVSVIAGLTGKAKEIYLIKEVAQEFLGEVLFGYGTDTLGKEICTHFKTKVPCVILMKRNDPQNPQIIFDGDMENSELVDFVKKKRLPVFSELKVENFPMYYKMKRPLVLFFGDEHHNSNEFKALSEVALSSDITNHLFAWIDVSQVDSVGTQILQTYSSDAKIPSIAVINHAKGHVHIYDQEKYENAAISKWIKDIAVKKDWPTYIMPDTKWSPRHPGYDFHKLAETAKFQSDDNEYFEIANEHGIGFDANGEPVKYDGEGGGDGRLRPRRHPKKEQDMEDGHSTMESHDMNGDKMESDMMQDHDMGKDERMMPRDDKDGQIQHEEL